MSEATPTPQEPTPRPRKRPQGALLPWCLGGGLLAAVAVFFAAEAWLNSYLASEAFRGKTEAALGRALKAEARLAPLERQGATLRAERRMRTAHSSPCEYSAPLVSTQRPL